MSCLTKCLVRWWVFLNWGSFVNCCGAVRRSVNSSVTGLMGIFQFPDCSCLKLWAVMAIGSDIPLHWIFVTSNRSVVAGCSQRHLMWNSNGIWINKSVQDTDVWHLVISRKLLVHINQKIVPALVFPSIQHPFRVTKRLANSFVRTVMGIRIIASRNSVTCNLTCKGLPSGIEKIVFINCSPCKESGVHLQRMSECQLSNQLCYHQVDLK